MVRRPSVKPLRQYGSIDDSAESHSLHFDPSSSEQDHSQVRDVTTGWGRAKRWVPISVIGGLAVGAIIATIGARYPPVSTIVGKGSGNIINANDEVGGSFSIRADAGPAIIKDTTRGASSELAPLDFTALNFYHVRDGKPAQDYPWLQDIKLIEPYRETTLAVIDPREGFEYRWEVRGGSDAGEIQTSAIGVKAVVVFMRLDENVITLKEIDSSDGTVVRQFDETVMVKYVRREIRTLTDEEREELLDAVRHDLYFLLVLHLLPRDKTYQVVGSSMYYSNRSILFLLRSTISTEEVKELQAVPQSCGSKSGHSCFVS